MAGVSDTFNGYHVWLGIPPSEQPPNHYRLLGITVFETDLDVIDHAADRQMAHVRTFQSGRHGALSQQILNELASARLCLLNREKKSLYDDDLRAKLSGVSQTSTLPMGKAVPVVKPVAPPKAPPVATAPPVVAKASPPAPTVRTAPAVPSFASDIATDLDPLIDDVPATTISYLRPRRRSTRRPEVTWTIRIVAALVALWLAYVGFNWARSVDWRKLYEELDQGAKSPASTAPAVRINDGGSATPPPDSAQPHAPGAAAPMP